MKYMVSTSIVKDKLKAKSHLLMPGQTITGAIKLMNLHDVTAAEMPRLLEKFKAINGTKNFKAGETALIPILERHNATVFSKKRIDPASVLVKS